MRRSKGFRNNTRRLFYIGRSVRRTITKTLQTFDIGDKVLIKHDSSVQKGMPHPRHYGKLGNIVEKRGRAYRVAVKDGNKAKSLIARSEHLQKAN